MIDEDRELQRECTCLFDAVHRNGYQINMDIRYVPCQACTLIKFLNSFKEGQHRKPILNMFCALSLNCQQFLEKKNKK